MNAGEFRCAYFAREYDRVVAFYRDGLAMPVADTWDKGESDKGTIFQAASGLIEIMAMPPQPAGGSAWDFRPPQGMMLVVEVGDVDGLFARCGENAVEIVEPVTDQPWGHRSFIVSDPEGLRLYLFSPEGT